MCELAGFVDKRANSSARLLELSDERRLVLVRITKPLHVRYTSTRTQNQNTLLDETGHENECHNFEADMAALELRLCLCDLLFVQQLVRLHSAMLLASPLLKRLRAEREAREAKATATQLGNKSQSRRATPTSQPAAPAAARITAAQNKEQSELQAKSVKRVSFQFNAERVLLDWLDDPLPPACVATPLARLELSDIDLQLRTGPNTQAQPQHQQMTSSSELEARPLSPVPSTRSHSLSDTRREKPDVYSQSGLISAELRLIHVLRVDIHNRFANAFESCIAPWRSELCFALDLEPPAASPLADGSGSDAPLSRHLRGSLSADKHLLLSLSPLAIDLIATLLSKIEKVQSLADAKSEKERARVNLKPCRFSSDSLQLHPPARNGIESLRRRDEPDLQPAEVARGTPVRSLSPSPALFQHSTHVAPRQLGLSALLLPTSLLQPATGPQRAPAPAVDGPAEEHSPDGHSRDGPDDSTAAPVALRAPENLSPPYPPEQVADETLQFDEYARLHCKNLLVSGAFLILYCNVQCTISLYSIRIRTLLQCCTVMKVYEYCVQYMYAIL